MKQILFYIAVLSFLSLHCKKNAESIADHAGGSYNQSINPGQSSRDFLTSTNYRSLKIEIQYMPGLEPDPQSIKIFVDVLKEKLNKPAGIIVEEKQINPTLLTVFNLGDISGIESRNRTAYTSGDRMGAYILFISGTYYTSNILGLTYTNTSICYFGEPLKYFLSGGTPADKTNKLALLLLHEFGHLLGLVNIGSPMVVDHLDNNNGDHCNNNICLMHHTLEEITPNIERMLLNNPSFDKNCSDDLKANGGK
jgi:hypothetical protein